MAGAWVLTFPVTATLGFAAALVAHAVIHQPLEPSFPGGAENRATRRME